MIRFIPTHVGNTLLALIDNCAIPVHPHACGKHIPVITVFIPTSGSSPRMWETQHHANIGKLYKRFIPTHVGNTSAYSLHAASISVHPHACGKHSSKLALESSLCGSSPRMWETLGSSFFGFGFCRFIPTHVGNTESDTSPDSISSVHPHACGKHDYERELSLIANGSSPRMWETLYYITGPYPNKRFIPTHVGNTTP